MCVSGKRCGAHDLFVKEIVISLWWGGELCDFTARNLSIGSLCVLHRPNLGYSNQDFWGRSRLWSWETISVNYDTDHPTSRSAYCLQACSTSPFLTQPIPGQSSRLISPQMTLITRQSSWKSFRSVLLKIDLWLEFWHGISAIQLLCKFRCLQHLILLTLWRIGSLSKVLRLPYIWRQHGLTLALHNPIRKVGGWRGVANKLAFLGAVIGFSINQCGLILIEWYALMIENTCIIHDTTVGYLLDNNLLYRWIILRYSH